MGGIHVDRNCLIEMKQYKYEKIQVIKIIGELRRGYVLWATTWLFFMFMK